MSYQLPPYVFLMRKLPVPPYDFSVNFRCMCKVFFVFEGEVINISQSFALFLAMENCEVVTVVEIANLQRLRKKIT